MKRMLWVVALILVTCGGLSAQRLPETVVPESYRITFAPDLAKATFTGEETIRVQVRQQTPSITLSSAEIEFQKVEVTAGGSTQKATVTKDDKAEMATLTLEHPLAAGPAEIHIQFTGILNDQLRGFYLSQTERRRYAVTQFEATDARRAFPGFDEPAMKATFDITLVIDKGDTAISNGKIVSDTPGPGEGKHTLVFSTTPKMSTYLVAMLVGDFECLEGATDGIPIRVCAVPEKKNLGAYALTAAESILGFYNKYYAIKYPFQKLDIIALPDFAAGAMENTAAITYREPLLLIDDKTASVNSHRAVWGVLAHEMAHQWFGDLVTMKWWDNIWLNEGFATWMANKPVEAAKPEWHAELDEIQETTGALNGDGIASIRAIRSKADTPAEIANQFDGVAYGKAASVLRMIEAYVGPDVFRQGVNNYLQKHAYGNATAEDFWNAIAAASKKPVDTVMATFVNQPGAPLVTVHASCKADHTEVELSQQRFFADRAKLDAGSSELWQIPTCLTSPGSAPDCVVLTEKKHTFEVPGCRSWVFANSSGRGYYRSSYDSDTVAKIAAAASTKLAPPEQISFLDDTWAMVHVGRQPIGDFLSIVEGLKGESTRAVVETFLGRLQQIHDDIASPADRPAYEAWLRQLLRPMLVGLGPASPSESDEHRTLRSEYLGVLGYFAKDPDVIRQARTATDAYMNDPSSADPTFIGNALAVAADNGDAALYDKYMAHLKSAKTPEEYYAYLNGLTQFTDPVLVNRTLEFILSPAVKSQDLGNIGNLLGPRTQKQTWEFIKLHIKDIQEKAGPGLGAGIVGVANAFCDATLRDDAQKFFRDLNLPGSERPLRNALERDNSCIELRDLQQTRLSQFLKQAQTTAQR
jgi:aminopeptidase N